jgi:uncharacterized membrane protein (Fun14 family)
MKRGKYQWRLGHTPDSVGTVAATLVGGFFGGILIGYALKKVVKVVAVVIGLFFAGLAYLQYQQIIDIKWAKLQSVSQHTLTTLANATTQIPGFNNVDHAAAVSNLGIPLTGSMSMGIAIGFMKG